MVGGYLSPVSMLFAPFQAVFSMEDNQTEPKENIPWSRTVSTCYSIVRKTQISS
jgi:hypothetical protein